MNTKSNLSNDIGNERDHLSNLFDAAAADDVDQMEAAFKKGERMDTTLSSLHNRNPMHLACINGSRKFFEAALTHPTFNPFLFDNFGRRPIEYAHAYKHTEMERALLDHMYPPPPKPTSAL
jgi:ankyrin repeat protein